MEVNDEKHLFLKTSILLYVQQKKETLTFLEQLEGAKIMTECYFFFLGKLSFQLSIKNIDRLT